MRRTSRRRSDAPWQASSMSSAAQPIFVPNNRGSARVYSKGGCRPVARPGRERGSRAAHFRAWAAAKAPNHASGSGPGRTSTRVVGSRRNTLRHSGTKGSSGRARPTGLAFGESAGPIDSSQKPGSAEGCDRPRLLPARSGECYSLPPILGRSHPRGVVPTLRVGTHGSDASRENGGKGSFDGSVRPGSLEHTPQRRSFSVFSEACFKRPIIPEARFWRSQGLGGYQVTSRRFGNPVHRPVPVKTNRRFFLGGKS
jgi:hypothetical protein